MSKRFAICDEVGKVLNVILMDDQNYPTNWYPGYGRYLVALEVAQWPDQPIHPTKMTFNPIQVQGRCGPGDTINLQTGVVTLLTPPTPPPLTKEELRAYAANKRWEVETGGAQFGILSVPTDDRAKTMIGRAARTNSEVASTPYIVGGVNYGVLTKAQFEAMDAAIDIHVAATFATLASVLTGIGDGTITTYAQIDAASWPANG
jgi:hypothetical protein